MFKTIPRYLHFCYLGDKKAPYIASRSWQLRPDKRSNGLFTGKTIPWPWLFNDKAVYIHRLGATLVFGYIQWQRYLNVNTIHTHVSFEYREHAVSTRHASYPSSVYSKEPSQ